MEQFDDEENEVVDNNVTAPDAQVHDARDTEIHDDDVLQRSPPVLQQQIQSLVDGSVGNMP